MRLWRLWLIMGLSLMLVIAVTSAFTYLVLAYTGVYTPLLLAIIVAIWLLVEWLSAPGMLSYAYRLRPVEDGWLVSTVEQLAKRSGLKRTPKVYIADIPIPNAFAFGNILTGPRVAVTKPLLEILDRDEVEAVLGHELGHIRHRDVQIMMMLSVLPAAVYMVSRYLLWGGLDTDRDSSKLFILGATGMLVYFVLQLLILAFSRYREYYADAHSVGVVENGALKLASALAKISNKTSIIRMRNPRVIMGLSHFKALFITDPQATTSVRISHGVLIAESIAQRSLTLTDLIMELFSTHPHIVKRLRVLLREAGIKVEEY